MLLYLKLCLFLLLVSSYSKADCLPDVEGLCIPGVTITEDTQIDITEEDKGTEIITTTTTTVTTTTTTVTNEDSGNILDSNNGYVTSADDGNMNIDWGGQGPASMPSGSSCYELGTDKCAEITGSGDNTSAMGVSDMGTTFIIQNIDISDLEIDKGGQVKYTIEVDKRDAQDRIYMHVTGYNGTTSVFSGTDVLSESGVSSGYQSYDGAFNFSGVLNKITVEVGGRDINLAIGPLFDDVTVNVFYNVINTIITQQITTIEEIYYLNLFDPVELDFVEEVFEFNDVSMNEGEIEFTPIEAPIEEITVASVELEIAEIEINLPEPEVEIVEVETEVEMEIEMEMEEVLVVEAEPEEEITEEPQEESQEPEQEEPQTPQKEEDPEETVEEEKSSEPKVSKKEKAATKIVKKIDDKARYDDAAQTKTLIVMQILGNTKTFFDSQSFIQDTNVTEYLNKTIDDQYGMLFDMAQENTIQEMINAQY